MKYIDKTGRSAQTYLLMLQVNWWSAWLNWCYLKWNCEVWPYQFLSFWMGHASSVGLTHSQTHGIWFLAHSLLLFSCSIPMLSRSLTSCHLSSLLFPDLKSAKIKSLLLCRRRFVIFVQLMHSFFLFLLSFYFKQMNINSDQCFEGYGQCGIKTTKYQNTDASPNLSCHIIVSVGELMETPVKMCCSSSFLDCFLVVLL